MSEAKGKISHDRCGHDAVGQGEDFGRGEPPASLPLRVVPTINPNVIGPKSQKNSVSCRFRMPKIKAGADTM